jgi:hypothetical protein
MKKLLFLLISVTFLMTFNSCKKDKEETQTNFFSFDGKNYTINEKELIALVANSGTDSMSTMYILFFTNIAGNDTTTAFFTLFDSESNTLGGSYPSIDIGNTTATKAIVPFALFFFSGIGFQDGNLYFTGNGGSIDVTVSSNNYEITMNTISAGDYADLFDSDPEDGNFEYSEVGKIGGTFNGTIVKQTEILSLNLNSKIEKIRKSIEERVK